MNDAPTLVDLEYLWRVGNTHMPALADKYDGIQAQMGGRLSDETGIFDRKVPGAMSCDPDMEQGNEILNNDVGQGPVYPKYVQLRDAVEAILGETSRNLRDTAAALNAAAWEYSRTDGKNADDLKAQLDLANNGMKIDYNIPQ